MSDNNNNFGSDIVVEAIDEDGLDMVSEPLIPVQNYEFINAFNSIYFNFILRARTKIAIMNNML